MPDITDEIQGIREGVGSGSKEGSAVSPTSSSSSSGSKKEKCLEASGTNATAAEETEKK